MSTDRKSRNEEIHLTTFFGGKERGKCLQIGMDNTEDGYGYIQLTKQEAYCLNKDLQDFCNDDLPEYPVTTEIEVNK